jgi:hypothetical protein
MYSLVLLASQGSRLSPEQLCELLPLVQEADLAVPTDWLQEALAKIQVRKAAGGVFSA